MTLLTVYEHSLLLLESTPDHCTVTTNRAGMSDCDSHKKVMGKDRKRLYESGLSLDGTSPDLPMLAHRSAQQLCQNLKNSEQDESVDLG